MLQGVGILQARWDKHLFAERVSSGPTAGSRIRVLNPSSRGPFLGSSADLKHLIQGTPASRDTCRKQGKLQEGVRAVFW